MYQGENVRMLFEIRNNSRQLGNILGDGSV